MDARLGAVASAAGGGKKRGVTMAKLKVGRSSGQVRALARQAAAEAGEAGEGGEGGGEGGGGERADGRKRRRVSRPPNAGGEGGESGNEGGGEGGGTPSKSSGDGAPGRQPRQTAAEKRKEKQAAALAALQLAWPLGATVEVIQRDAGYAGSWYAAEVTKHGPKGDALDVRYFELLEADDERPELPPSRLVSREAALHLRPPPPAPSAARRAEWLAGLKAGDTVELSFDGGWWGDMEVTAVAEAEEAAAAWAAIGADAAAAEGAAEGGRRYSLSSTRFLGAEHTVGRMSPTPTSPSPQPSPSPAPAPSP